MAKTENYIGVAMGLDVTDLKQGLSEANKKIQLANAQFKAAASGMDDWTKSTEGISAKTKQLAAVLGAQESKLAGLKAEYKKVAREQGENSDAAQKLRIQIYNQQAVVNKTQKEYDTFADKLDLAEQGLLDVDDAADKGTKAVKKFGDAAADGSKDAKDLGDSAKEGGKGLEGLKSVAGGVVGSIAAVGAAVVGVIGSFFALAESTREYREDMNKLQTGFQTAGFTAEQATETYKDFFAVLGEEDRSVEAVNHLAQLCDTQEELDKWTTIAAGVWGTFGDSLPIEGLTEAANETAKVGKVTGPLADALNWAGVSEDAFNASLEACNNEQERAQLITETLNGLYSEAAEKYRELNGDIMDAQRAQSELTDALAELGAIAEPIITTLKLAAADLLKVITPFVELIGDGLTLAFTDAGAGAALLAKGISGMLSTVIEKITEAVPTVLDVIAGMIPSLIGVIATAIPQIITAVVSVIPQITQALFNALPILVNCITQIITSLLTSLGVLLPQIVQQIIAILPVIIQSLINAIPQLLEAATQFLMAIVDAIPTLIESLLVALPGIIDTIISGLLEALPQLLEAAITLLMAIVDAFPVILDAIIENLPMILDAIINGVLDALPQLLEAAITLFFALIEASTEIKGELLRRMPEVIETILKSLRDALPKMFKTAKELLGQIASAIVDFVKGIPSKMGEIISAIVGGLKKGISDVSSIGSDIVKGLWEGISDMAGWIGEKIQSFGSNVLGEIKDFFGIASPSKLIEEEVGVNIGKAFVPSRPASLSKVKKQLSQFSGFVADNLGDIKTGLSLDAGGAVGGQIGRNTVVNAGLTVNYNGRLSRREIKQLENDNYTAIRTRLKAEGAI